MEGAFEHVPVLRDEVLAALVIRADGCYLDATFGRGGHTAAILERLGPSGCVLALDRDPAAIAAGRKRFSHEGRLRLVHRAFGELSQAACDAGVSAVDGVLLDLGVSSPQLDDPARGFSFLQNGPLDMRMDYSTGASAAAWLAKVPERELVRVLFEYGEERYARRIAHAVDARRREAPIRTTAELAAIVSAAVTAREPGKHPATRTFQAIRIAVNEELEQLRRALEQVIGLLAPAGRLCVISFHSLEDRIVKQFIQQHSHDDPVYAGLPHVPEHARAKLRRIGRAMHPSTAEVSANPRARSAILRVAEKVAV